MSLDLEKMAKQIDEQLAKETRLSLTVWFAKNTWQTYGAKGIVRIIKLYGALLIPLKIYKWLKSDRQKQL